MKLLIETVIGITHNRAKYGRRQQWFWVTYTVMIINTAYTSYYYNYYHHHHHHYHQQYYYY